MCENGNQICRRKGAIFVGPENVFVRPPCRRVSYANSVRIEIIFVANGPTAEER